MSGNDRNFGRLGGATKVCGADGIVPNGCGDSVLNVDFRGGTVFAGKLKEGQERALTTTSDGKLGFRELLGDERQDEWLNARSARWENKPSGDSLIANT